MSVEPPKSRLGIVNQERFIERTLWTTSTFIVANTIAAVFFSGQSFANRAAFSLIQGGVFVFLFESKAVEKQVREYKKSFDHTVAHQVIDYAFFFFLGVLPIVLARTITTWVFQPLTLREGFRVGLFNYVAGVAGAAAYDKIFKPESSSEPPPVRSSAPMTPSESNWGKKPKVDPHKSW